MTTQEVANKLVQLCSEGKFDEAIGALYSDDIVSMEASAASRWIAGIEGASQPLRARPSGGLRTTKCMRRKVEGPLVAGAHFAATFQMDITFEAAKHKRFQMEEVAIYKVITDGKVVYEEFFYNM